MWSWKANLRVNLFRTGLFSSSELSSVGRQRWHRQQGSEDSETHGSTDMDVSRLTHQNRPLPWCYVRHCAGMDRETQSQRAAAAEACWKIEHTTFMLLGPFLSALHRMLTWVLATCFWQTAIVHSWGSDIYIVYIAIHTVRQLGTGLILNSTGFAAWHLGCSSTSGH